MPYYSPSFFQGIQHSAESSASFILPTVINLLHPRSIIDVGCGDGTWLSVAVRLNVPEVFGVEGPWLDPKSLKIPQNRFQHADLRQPFALQEKFDLALSLEVAEHLPAASAAAFIASLVALAPAVLFSAAVPRQGGNFHINEQWHDYWAALFAQHQYVPIDCVRPIVWSNPAVAYWYSQNSLLYARPELIDRLPDLKAAHQATRPGQLSIVHPRLFEMRTRQSRFKRFLRGIERPLKQFRERLRSR